MKKMIAILMVMMMFGLVACGNQDETDGGKVTNSGSADDEFDWMKGECVIDGKEIQLPCKFSDLEAMGWKIQDDSELPEDMFLSLYTVYLVNDNYDSFINVNLFTDEEGDIEISDYDVISIIVTSMMEDAKDVPPFSVDGLKLGDSKDKMFEILGEKEESFPGAPLPSYTYKKYEGDILYSVNIGLKDEKIYMLGVVAQPMSQN